MTFTIKRITKVETSITSKNIDIKKLKMTWIHTIILMKWKKA